MKNNKKKSAIVALSGGVDSAVAAVTMKRRGYDCLGVFLRLHENYAEAEAAARRVAEKLGLRFYPVNAERQFTAEVVENFVKNYGQGATPNPCVRCNREIKFGVLLRLLHELGGETLATGHYARVVQAPGAKNSGAYKLLKGADAKKDQSYFLYTLGQDILKRAMFPVGEYEKEQIRAVAGQLDLPVLKQESQDVCFLTKDGTAIDHNEFLKSHLELQTGPIFLVGKDKAIGEHKGLPLYTIGQRKGIEIGGSGPYYVVKQDWKNNSLIVSTDADDPALYSDEFTISHVNWVSGHYPELPLKCELVHRYRHPAVPCVVVGGKEDGQVSVKLKKPERAVTPGQSAVFYLGDEVVGGGVIE